MKKTRSFISLLLGLTILAFTAFSLVEANKHHHKRKHRPPSPTAGSDSYNILSFGAKGDGISDDSKALLAAWKAACRVGSARLEIPAGFKFLIKPLTLQGPCMPQLVLQIEGTLLAPPKGSSWPKSSLFQWINFKWVNDFTIQGPGTINGQGYSWWTNSNQMYDVQKRHKDNVPSMKPTALRFYASNDVTVRDVEIRDSPLCHLKFDNSNGVKVHNVTISSPEASPNTDGIHLQNTRNVKIHHSNIACGDDCVSIQTGCSNVHVHHIKCGPGHGVSLGGLGKDKSVACVSDITVEHISVKNALYGVRMKTWQGGVGLVKNVSFSDIHVSDVEVPIMIDQYYCDRNECKNQTGAVAISGVSYNRVMGTYTLQPMHLACSDEIPCTDVDLVDIQLTPSRPSSRGLRQALCWNTHSMSQPPLLPSGIDYCLRNGAGSLRRASRSHESVCH